MFRNTPNLSWPAIAGLAAAFVIICLVTWIREPAPITERGYAYCISSTGNADETIMVTTINGTYKLEGEEAAKFSPYLNLFEPVTVTRTGDHITNLQKIQDTEDLGAR